MKRRGFTLIEVLIAVCVIGVLSALIAPTISNIAPDRGRVAVIKFHSKLAELNSALLADEALYTTIKDNNGDFSCVGLGCTGKTLRTGSKYDDDNYSGVAKYLNIVSANLGIENPKVVVDNATDEIEFQFSPEVRCLIHSTSGTININDSAAATLTSVITLTVSDHMLTNHMANCPYNTNTCPNPNQYVLNVDTYGNITGGDNLTRVFLRNPTRMNNKKQDFIDAKNM